MLYNIIKASCLYHKLLINWNPYHDLVYISSTFYKCEDIIQQLSELPCTCNSQETVKNILDPISFYQCT